MRLPRLAIDNYQFTVILIALLVLSGLVSFLTMPRAEDPMVTPPGSTVIVIYPGASPEDVEELIVDPIEGAINELEDIKEIDGYAGEGLATVAVEFFSGSDPEEKYSEVVQKVNSIQSELPADIYSLEIEKWSVNLVSILQLAVVSDTAEYRELEQELERLENRIKNLYGVRSVETWAFPDQQVRVSVNLEKIAQYHIPLNMVMGAIQSANANIPGGNVDVGDRRFTIQTSGSYETVEDVATTVVRASGENVVRLRDVARVGLGYGDETYRARYNGRRAVFLSVTQKNHTNIFSVMEGLREAIEEFKGRLPENMELHYVFEQSKSVATRLNGFFLNLLQGLALVGVIVFLSVSLRSSVIVMIAIPLSILIGIGFVDMTGYGLQQMSIAGLVIALGLLVDNAIVVTENITRFMKMGYPPREAAYEGTSQIGWAVVSSTLTTVLAFVPIIMMRDVTGDFIRSMPVTVVYTLLASLLMSLTLTPYLSSRFIRVPDDRGESRIRKALNRFVDLRYKSILEYALNRPGRIMTVAIVVFLISLSLFGVVGVSYFPKAEKPMLLIDIDLPDGTSLDRTDEVAGLVEAFLDGHPEVAAYATNVGHGNPRVYYNMWSRREDPDHAQIFVLLDRYRKETLDNLIAEARRRFGDFPGARIEIREFEQGPPVAAPLEIIVMGENLDVLRRIARDVEGMIAGTPNTTNINNPLGTSRTDIEVRINRAKAGMLGLSVVDVDRTVRASMAGLAVGEFSDPDGKEYDIVVRLPTEGKPTLEHFDRIYVSSANGAQVPLKQVASVGFKAAPMTIDHFNMERSVSLTADVVGDASVEEATRSVMDQLNSYNWPRGYRYYVAGETESRQESFGGMGRAVVIAVIAILGVLVLQFRSYLQPMIVFSAIPLAIIGSILALLITGNTFSFTAFIGITSLVGIVINNSIILVDYTNQLRRRGSEIKEALMKAGQTRFIPIILTTATTVAGLLPLTLAGGTMWAPMGWTIIGGLLISTMLTLVVVPVLYRLLTRA
jgi:multidrug efflux pump subunit AcrB